MKWRPVSVIARREYGVTVRRREFLLVTFGLPLLYLLIAVVVGAATASAVGKAINKNTPAPNVTGFFDASRTLPTGSLPRVFASEEAGRKAIRDKTIRAFVVVAKDFAKTGRITVYEPDKGSGIFSSAGANSGSRSAFSTALRRAQLTGKVDEATITQFLRPLDVATLSLNPKSGVFEKPDPLRILSKFVVPYAFSLLLMMGVLFSSSYLLHGIVEEKENRVIEVLLSSVSHEELLAGKLLGLGAAGMTQFAVWVSGAAVGAIFAVRLAASLSDAFVIGPGILATALLMFLTGYALYAALLAGLGSLGTSWRESQQIAGFAGLFLVIPLTFLPVLLEDPDGSLARGLSLFPFTAPIGMMLRVAAGGASLAEVLLSAALMIVTTMGVMRLSARLFRLSLLMYGQRPGVVEVTRFLFGRVATSSAKVSRLPVGGKE